MNSLIKTTQETKPAGATGGILSRPAAAVTLAGSLSVLTLAASLYLFVFAGRDLLPPPPIAGLPASRILEPVPMNSLSELAPGIEVPPVPAAAALPVFLAANIPAVETAAVPSDTTGTVAGASVEPFPEDDDDDENDNGRSSSRKDGQKKNKQSESRSISAGKSSNESKVSRHED